MDNTSGLCMCGCGQRTSIAKQSDKRDGVVKGQPLRFVKGHNRAAAKHPKAPAGFKTCPKCGDTKPVDEFHRATRAPDGRVSHCKDCVRAAHGHNKRKPPPSDEERRQRANERVGKWRQENRERLLEYRRAWYALNAERERQRQRDFWDALSEEERQRRGKRYNRSRSREAARDNARRQKARRKQAPVIETVIRAVVFDRDGGLCGLCGEPVDPTRYDLDHIVPLKHGGEHSYANVQLAHPVCNMRKGIRLNIEP
jgi:5-methylcytosine-specific restriction endonuclease McrA